MQRITGDDPCYSTVPNAMRIPYKGPLIYRAGVGKSRQEKLLFVTLPAVNSLMVFGATKLAVKLLMMRIITHSQWVCVV